MPLETLTSGNDTREILTSLRVPAIYLQHIDVILREEGIQSAEELRELLELHALPVGHGKPFEGFSERDFADDCKGVREKMHDLLTLRTMFHSHHVEPWKDHDA